MTAVIAVAVSVIAIAVIICVIVVLAPMLTRWITAYWEWEERQHRDKEEK